MKKAVLRLSKDYHIGKTSLNEILGRFDMNKYGFNAAKCQKVNDQITLTRSNKYWIDVFTAVKQETGQDLAEAVFGRKKLSVQDAVEQLNPIIFYKGTMQREIFYARVVMG